MDIQTSIKTCFIKYAIFSGRASRSEYWFFFLFSIICSLVIKIIEVNIYYTDQETLSRIFIVIILIPQLAVGCRRLHDTNKSGWWVFIAGIPIIGTIILFYWLSLPGDDKKNRFGPPINIKNKNINIKNKNKKKYSNFFID